MAESTSMGMGGIKDETSSAPPSGVGKRRPRTVQLMAFDVLKDLVEKLRKHEQSPILKVNGTEFDEGGPSFMVMMMMMMMMM